MNVHRHGVPRAGRSLEGQVAPLREKVAEAVGAAALALGEPFGWLRDASSGDVIAEPDWLSRSAWAAVAIALVEAAWSAQPPRVDRALRWFGTQSDGLADGRWDEVDSALAPLDEPGMIAELLPYLLDTYGRTTRLDVLKDGGRGSARKARKQAGSFYTPVDLVGFMVNAVSSPENSNGSLEQWLDPASGSGVFLAGALRQRRFDDAEARCRFATTRLHGCDISPQACDFTAFTLLALLAGTQMRPVNVWRSIRANMRALDSTRIPGGPAGLRALLGLDSSPLRLICNPPYASAGDGTHLSDGFPTRALYLPFVEMAWTVANGPEDTAVLVVPLALGANRSADHRRCRAAMAASGGHWTLLFFDRQPHALFGEEAKTRATIAIRRPGRSPADIRTSRLLKWTSRQRASIFTESRSTPLGPLNIARLVPKLGCPDEQALYASLEPFRLRSGLRPDPVKATADEIVGARLSNDVYVAGTAYNFLNVFRNYPDHLSWRGNLSASGIHRLPCRSAADADMVTAVLCSRLAFWMWHVECDGFHVPAWFLSELPLLNLRPDGPQMELLAELGRSAWAGVQQDVHCAVNRDRLTFAFRPSQIAAVRTAIDRSLLELVGADPALAEILERFETQVVSIDGTARRAPQFQNTGEKE